MTATCDVAIVGAGIVGLAHAWMAARRGLQVVVFERSPQARGASVRNFGMIWPIGQPAGDLHALAMNARTLWLELDQRGVVRAEQCGSLHLAHRDDEWAVLQEFAERQSHDVRLLTPAEVVARSSLAQPEGLRGGMFSAAELRVDPRTASARLTAWLQQQPGVTFRFCTPVVGVDRGSVRCSDGTTLRAERVIVCSNDDFETLFPDQLRESGLKRCKLQMLRTSAQADAVAGSPHIASGLTLRHYASFVPCASLAGLRERIAHESPELDRYGIHVMASPFPNGEVILGDSHEYDDEITPFDKSEIDDLILRELRRVIRLSDWSITERWHGIYARHPERPIFERAIDESVHLSVGTGGAGMTLAFGIAERMWNQWS